MRTSNPPRLGIVTSNGLPRSAIDKMVSNSRSICGADRRLVRIWTSVSITWPLRSTYRGGGSWMCAATPVDSGWWRPKPARAVVAIDSSHTALEEGRKAAARNDIDQIEFVEGDCFETLKEMGERGERFDGVVLDPPRFAGSRHQIDRALRAYGRLNSLAVDLLPPGGMLVTCSCSGRVTRADFLNMLVEVAKRKRRDLIVMEQRGPAPDHPVAISCPESDYLKCVIAQVC